MRQKKRSVQAKRRACVLGCSHVIRARVRVRATFRASERACVRALVMGALVEYNNFVEIASLLRHMRKTCHCHGLPTGHAPREQLKHASARVEWGGCRLSSDRPTSTVWSTLAARSIHGWMSFLLVCVALVLSREFLCR